MNQKHMDSIFLEVYVGLKIKGGTRVELEDVLKANVQRRMHHFLLEARRIAADVKVQVGSALPVSAVILLAASCDVPGPCKQHPANAKQTPPNREAEIVSELQIQSPGKANRFSNKGLALSF